jgi:branched-chain amino acid transport system permease protein
VFILLAVLFGGGGTSLGPVVGTAILLLLPEALHTFDKYRLMVHGGLILLTLYILPNGIVGEILRRTALKKGSTGAADAVAADTTQIQASIEASGATLQIEGLSHTFGGLVALSKVNFCVERQAIHALIGPNGAGKTTIINIVTGVHATQSGRILIDGVQAKNSSLHLAARQGIVRTFQNVNTFGDMNAVEHVMIGLSNHQRISIWRSLLLSRRTRELWTHQSEEALALLNLVGISHLQHVPASSLSYGHRRLIEIARALAAKPRVLLLDEPAAGLVADEVRQLAALIKTLQRIGITVLLVEHNIDLVLSVSDRVTVLDRGCVIADGPPDLIRRDERVIAAYLGPSYSHA